MATCQCVGDTCVCEAIKVPPKLPFWKKHDRHVHGFVAWMAVLNVTLLASLPIALYAQTPDPTSSATTPSVVSGVDSCINQCEVAKNRCGSDSATGTQEQRSLTCNARAKDCYALCVIAPHLGLPPKGATPPKGEDKGPRRTDSASSSSEREKQKRDLNKRIATAKKRMSEFSRNLASIKLKVTQLEKKGMTVPAGLKEALAKGDALVAELKAVDTQEEAEALSDIQGSMESTASTLKGSLGALEKQRKAPQKFAALEKQMRQFDHQLATTKKLVGDSADVAAQLAAMEQALTNVKDAYRQAHDLIVAGDVDGGYAILEGQMPGLMAAYKDAVKALYAARAQMTKS